MGQKIHPTGFRLSVNKDWASRWYANSRNFAAMLNEDLKVRDYLKGKLARNVSMSSPFLPMTTPGRALCMVMRAFFAGRSMVILPTEA